MSQSIVRFVPRAVNPGSFPAITPSRSPTVVLLTAVWGRPVVTRIFYEGALRFKRQMEALGCKVRIVAGGDEAEHRSLAADMGAEWVETPNLPLGRKWNNICESAFKGEGDYLFVLGSDDLVSPALVQDYAAAAKKGVPYCAINECLFFGTIEQKAFRFSQPGVAVGAGRMIHRNIMLAVNFRPWEDGLNKALDHSMDKKMLFRRVAVKWMPVDDSRFILDVKSNVNIWSYDRLRSVKPPEAEVSPDTLRCLPEWPLIQQINSLTS